MNRIPGLRKAHHPTLHRPLLVLGALCIAALALSSAAVASALAPTATLSGAIGLSMALPGNPSFGNTLDGTDQTVEYSALLGILDARGTGAGWNLQIAATAFDDGSGHTLQPGAVSAVSAACIGGSSCTAALNSIGYPLTVTATPAKFYDATDHDRHGQGRRDAHRRRRNPGQRLRRDVHEHGDAGRRNRPVGRKTRPSQPVPPDFLPSPPSESPPEWQ